MRLQETPNKVPRNRVREYSEPDRLSKLRNYSDARGDAEYETLFLHQGCDIIFHSEECLAVNFVADGRKNDCVASSHRRVTPDPLERT